LSYTRRARPTRFFRRDAQRYALKTPRSEKAAAVRASFTMQRQRSRAARGSGEGKDAKAKQPPEERNSAQ